MKHTLKNMALAWLISTSSPHTSSAEEIIPNTQETCYSIVVKNKEWENIWEIKLCRAIKTPEEQQRVEKCMPKNAILPINWDINQYRFDRIWFEIMNSVRRCLWEKPISSEIEA